MCIFIQFLQVPIYIYKCVSRCFLLAKNCLPMDSDFRHGVWQRSHSSPLPHSVDRLAGPNSVVTRSVSLQSAETGRGDLVGKYGKYVWRLKIWCTWVSMFFHVGYWLKMHLSFFSVEDLEYFTCWSGGGVGIFLVAALDFFVQKLTEVSKFG